jgi:uncharacterized protein DUF5719
MRSRARFLVTVAIVAIVAFAGAFLDRSVGVRGRGGVPSPTTTSGAWLCPHGGGNDWVVTLEIANPSKTAATVRVSSLGPERPTSTPKSYEVAPGATLAVPARAKDRASSSYVEFFGSWVAAGWVTHAGGGESGVAAEPCVEGAAGRWFAPDGTSVEGEDAYLILMNPFDTLAIIDVVLYTKAGAPARIGDLTGLALPPHRSTALLVSDEVVNEEALSAEVDVSRGRVAVASLGVSAATGGVRSTVGLAGDPPTRTYLPMAGAGERSSLEVLVPGTDPVSVDATVLSEDPPQPAGALTDQRQGAQSTEVVSFLTAGTSAIDVVTTGGVAVARRASGHVNDSGSTGGVVGPAKAWVVLPTVACDPNVPGLVLVNPGDETAEVTLHALPQAGVSAAPDVTVSVPPARALPAPQDFLSVDPSAAVLVTATSGTVIASGASSSCGKEGILGFAAAAGVPLPP